MSRSMLINVVQEEESRVAIVDNGVLDFFEIETLSSESLKGNIYKGVVENVNPSLEAAFVNCGWDRPGFLPLDEVNFRVLPTIKSRKSSSRILEHVAPGMEFLVQVIRDRFNSKPPSLTTYYSLPGRYLVLTPHADGSGISRRIEDEEQRAKLRKMVDDLRPPEGFGVIVRTAGLDQARSELVRDMGYLLRLWETVDRAAAVARAPSLIYRERDLALRTIRDHLTDEIEDVQIDDKEVYESALRFIRAVAPHQESRIHLYTGDKPVFSRFNLEDQIETIYKRRVPLKSGGEIVIEETEAMTAIDVNSSRSREATAGEMALRTNVEAAAEIARQLRLRDLGGLIVIDFIDMEQPKHARAVEKALRDAMRPDKAKYDATKISKLGILEISRQRLKAAKARATYVTCPSCDGSGTVRTTEAAALAALRKIQTRVVRGDISGLTATLPSDVALYLLNQKRDELLGLESRYAVRISLMPRPDYAKERCDIETAGREGTPPWALSQQPRPRPREDRESARPSREATQTGKGLEAAASAEEGRQSDPTSARTEAHLESAGLATGQDATRAEGAEEEAEPAHASAGRETEPKLEASPLSMMSEAFETEPAAPAEVASPAVLETKRDSSGRYMRRGEISFREDGEEPASVSPEAGDVSQAIASSPMTHGDEPIPPGERAPGKDAVAGPATLAEVPATPKKRRRRRGGRGRKRAASPGATTRPTQGASETLSGEDVEDEPEGRVVWEDAEDAADDSPVFGTRAGSEEQAPGVVDADDESADADNAEGASTAPSPERKKRRRRRGGRGRRKHKPGDGVVPFGGQEAPLQAAPGEVERETTPGAEHGTREPASRGRHRSRPRGTVAPQAVTQGPPVAARAATAHDARAAEGARRAESASEPVPPDDDVPGGWWSRLRGPKKRGGREG